MRENLGEVMHKKYTAHKIREMEAIVASGDIGSMTRENVALMLKQAAEMRDRLDEDIGRESTCEESSQVGNAAAMREALLEASIALSSATHHHLTEDDAKECLAVIESALSKPPRNCDVGTAEEQAKRFNSSCKTHLSGIRDICSPQCPCIECRSMFHCLTKWAQMQYE